MLERISWGEFWTAIIILAAIYEILIVLIFFRKEISQLALKSGKANADNTNTLKIHQQFFPNMSATTSNTENAAEKENNQLMPPVHDLVQTLKEFLSDVAERSFIKEEIIMGLQIIIREHKNLIGTQFQKSINDFIAAECDEKCSIHLSAEELNSVWLG